MTDFDQKEAHRYYSVSCFNKAWDLLDKPNRTPAEDEAMLRLSLASHWHWTQRENYGPKQASIGHWQTSRIFAVMKHAGNALRYAQLCLQAAKKEGVDPVYLGYAYEALTRAALVDGNEAEAALNLRMAHEIAGRVSDDDDRLQLLGDLGTFQIE